MKSKSLKLLSIVLLFSLLGCKPQPKVCIIKGELIDVNRPYVMLYHLGEDYSRDGVEIPVNDGKFSYIDTIDQVEVVEIFLQRHGGREQAVVLEEGEVKVTMHEEDERFKQNKIEGGKWNDELMKLKEYINYDVKKNLYALIDTINKIPDDLYYSENMLELKKQYKECKNQEKKKLLGWKKFQLKKTGQAYSQLGSEFQGKLKKEKFKFQTWLCKYTFENPSPNSYYYFYMNLLFRKKEVIPRLASETFQMLQKRLPNNPYHKRVGELINGLEQIKLGGQFIDFTAPDLEGKKLQLSKLVEGKYALIDLWSTTCGSCIVKSKSLIPIYNEFKDRNFTVVGVAGEFKNTNNLKIALKRLKFPWINLIELDRENSVWSKYGLPFASGGAVYLIDNKGKIVAIDPSAEEVRKVLMDRES
jgi:peroxiredoxin